MLQNLTAADSVIAPAPEAVITVIEVNQSAPATAATMTSPANSAKQATESRWILNCPLDLFFVCGGALWLLFFCALGADLVSNNSTDSVVSLLLIVGTLMFADSHNAATIVRFIDEPGLASRHPYVSVLAPVLMLTVVIGVLLSSSTYLALAVKLYLILIAQHVTAQAYGITMIYMRKSQIDLGPWQILVVKTAFTLMMVCGIAQQFSDFSTNELMGVQLPLLQLVHPLGIVVLVLLSILASLVMFGTIQHQCRKSGKKMHPGAVCLAGNTLMLFTFGPIFGPFALLAPAFFHGTQYLAVATANAMKLRSSDAQSAPPTQLTQPAQSAEAPLPVSAPVLSWDNLFYWTKLLTLGAVLYLVLPMLLSKLGFAPIAAMAAVFCTVNFHHFAADAVIWRRRKIEPNLVPVS